MAGSMEAEQMGSGFKSTEEQLVGHFLKKKLKGEMEASAIPELYIYDWSLRIYLCYTMTQLGYWKETSKKRVIRAPDTSKPMGTKRILVYYEGRQPKMAKVLCRIINRKSKEAKSATASASTDLSSHLSSAQAIPGVTTESDYPTETLNTGLHNRNVPIPDQQPQMGKEQPSCCGDNWHVDGPSDGRCHIPNFPSDGISITDFLNSDANSEQTQTCKEKHLLYDDNQHVDGPSDPSYGNGLEDLFN
ncbi:hypothetical protein ACJRO7_027598 [Eucalyptus globulus]|uniref:NAC domain-containing protein n=1 Tax=Eucalyptus globulus TaxID=34317 RepID=A0ABD3JWV7_EUCGL